MAVDLRLVGVDLAGEDLVEPNRAAKRRRLIHRHGGGEVEQALLAACLGIVPSADRPQEVQLDERERIRQAAWEEALGDFGRHLLVEQRTG